MNRLQKRACKLILGNEYDDFESAKATLNILSFEQSVFVSKATEADRGHFTVKLLCFFTLLQNFHFCKIFTSTFYCTSDFFALLGFIVLLCFFTLL